MSAATNKAKSSKQPEKKAVNNFLVFKKQNYILLILSVVVLVIGFTVMGSGDNSINITVWMLKPGQEKVVAKRVQEELNKASV